MKLVDHKIDRVRGKHRLYTSWRSQMRKPRKVVITETEADDYQVQETLAFDDKGHLFNFLAGMAEIAWACGWRPTGLSNTVAQVVASYRLPTETK